MPQDSAARFVTTLASAVMGDGEPQALARDAREALDGVFAAQKSLVLDVQFTGFVARGQPVGGISPELLRGAGQLIMMRVSRVGFTPDVRDEDLAAFFEIAAQGPGEIGAAGIVGAVKQAAPRGIYVSTSGGETYRPAPAAPAPVAPAASAKPVAEAEPAGKASADSTEAPATSAGSVAEAEPAGKASVDSSAEAGAGAGRASADQPAAAPSATVDAAAGSRGAASIESRPSGDSASQQEPATDAVKETAVEPSLAIVSDEVAAPVTRSPSDRPAETAEPEAHTSAGAQTEPAQAEAAHPSPEGPAAAPAAGVPSAFGFDDVEEGLAFTDFEVLEAFPDEPAEAPAPAAAQPAGEPGAGSDPSGGDLYHFFRASHAQVDPEAAELPGLLHRAESLSQFDEVAQGCARAAARLVSTDQHGAALDLLEALIREAERPDRSRVFREGAVQALRRAGTDHTLHSFLDYLQRHAEERDRVVRLFIFLGADTAALLEGLLFRTGDADLRAALFRRLAGQEGGSARLLARTMGDPTPGRTRAMLELATTSGLEPDATLRWISEAAAHADSTVRMDAARHAAALGGRGGLRVLVDLLSDADRLVKRSTIQGLGTLGDAAAVPFLARVLNDTSDEDVQMAVIAALGRIASPEALPTLVNVVNKRQLFSGKKLVRVKIAALTAISRLPGAAAREVLSTVAAGRDGELAPEARRILALPD